MLNLAGIRNKANPTIIGIEMMYKISFMINAYLFFSSCVFLADKAMSSFPFRILSPVL